MSDKQSSNEQLETVKRHLGELIDDMRTRKLLLPAGVLLVAIVAAIIMLPNKSEPVVPPTAATPPIQTKQVKQEQAIEISLVKPSAVGSGPELTSSSNPFLGTSSYDCTTISSGTPKVLSCEISGLKVRVTCPADAADPPCAKPEGSTGGGGSTEDTGSGSTGSTGGTSEPKKTPVKVYEYRVSVLFDNKSIKSVRPNEDIPSPSQPYVIYTGVNDSASRASFKAASGSSVTGVTVDRTGLVFVLKEDQTATITTISGEVHKLKLTAISKVKL